MPNLGEEDMPAVYKYNPGHLLLLVHVNGHVVDDALNVIYRQIRSIVSQVKIELGIFDLADADLSEITSETIRNLASSPPMLPEPARRCVVAPAAYQFGLARMFQMVADRDIDICRSMAEAYALLGLHPPIVWHAVSLDAKGRMTVSAPRKQQKAG